jgi:hypothetical protein
VDLARFALYHRTADSLAPSQRRPTHRRPYWRAPARLVADGVVDRESCEAMTKETTSREMLRMKEGTYFPSQA